MKKCSEKYFKFYNSLRCPLCNGQLDGIINDLKADLYCVQYPAEYKANYAFNNEIPYIEKFSYLYNMWEYVLVISHEDGRYYSKLSKLDASFMEYFRHRSEKEIINIKAKFKFLPKNLKEEDFLKKVKVYLTFS